MNKSLDRYKFCNYCKHYKHIPGRETSGYCIHNNSGKFGYMVTGYDISGCNDFEMTIHNSFNLEYPEYLKEYADKEHIKHELKWAIYYYHTHGIDPLEKTDTKSE